MFEQTEVAIQVDARMYGLGMEEARNSYGTQKPVQWTSSFGPPPLHVARRVRSVCFPNYSEVC